VGMNLKIGSMGLLLGLCVLLAGVVGHASAPETKIKWFGHSAFSITTTNGKVLLIDPWLRNPSNPDAKDGKDPLALIPELTIFSLRMDTATTWAGFVIAIRNGPTIYHSGDTAYFKDMETIGEIYSIDVALINIGGHFGMEPKMAARAALSVRAKLAVPHHFGTFPGIVENADGFSVELKRLKIPFYEMKPGETISFRGKQLAQRN